MFNVKVTGSDLVIKQLRNKAAEAQRIVDNELNGFALDTVAEAKTLAPANEGALRSAIGFVKKQQSITITVNVDYAAYVEFGTRKFAAQYVSTLPPTWQQFAAQFKGPGGGTFEEFVQRLVRWVMQKGIGQTYNVSTRRRDRVGKQSAKTTAEADAYAIALHILRNGIRPHPYLVPAFEHNRLELIKNLKAQLKAL